MFALQENKQSTSPYSAADLPIDEKGRIYHLQLYPQQLAAKIILVGDPGRVKLIAKAAFSCEEVDHEHRGLRSITGTVRTTGERVSLITTGMGTSSLEIVLQELVALNEIDFSTRTRKGRFSPLTMIRVGTCGGLQQNTPVGTPIITSYALGMDNSGLFYEAPIADAYAANLEREVQQLLFKNISSRSRFRGAIHPYAAKASPKVVTALSAAADRFRVPYKIGITVANSGFFANQGRDIARVPAVFPGLDRLLAEMPEVIPGQRCENMEMESSLFLHIGGALGYPCGSICIAAANRVANTFCSNVEQAITLAGDIALQALTQL